MKSVDPADSCVRRSCPVGTRRDLLANSKFPTSTSRRYSEIVRKLYGGRRSYFRTPGITISDGWYITVLISRRFALYDNNNGNHAGKINFACTETDATELRITKKKKTSQNFYRSYYTNVPCFEYRRPSSRPERWKRAKRKPCWDLLTFHICEKC